MSESPLLTAELAEMYLSKLLKAEAEIGRLTARHEADNASAEQADNVIRRLKAQIERLQAVLKALLIQAIQSTVNDPANEWGQEALEMARRALEQARKE